MAGQRAILVWKRIVCAAFRIALAYAIVGCTVLYSRDGIRKYVQYPSFSYMTATLIVWETTLGDTLRGTWHAFIGTCLVTGATILSLWLVRLDQFTPELAAVVVAVGTFAIVLMPKFIPLLSKRIALCGLVIVYVGTAIDGPDSRIVMRPLYVAASTTLGAGASILAMLLPFPHLATLEVKNKCKQYNKNAQERMNLFMKAMVAEDSAVAIELEAKAKILKEKARKLTKIIQRCQECMMWEVPYLKLTKPAYKQPADTLKQIEVALQGMEMAVAASRLQSPGEPVDERLKDAMQSMTQELTQKFSQIKTSFPFSTPTAPVQNPKSAPVNHLPSLDIYGTKQQLSMSFFLFCTKYLTQESSGDSTISNRRYIWEVMLNGWLPCRQDIILATKWSLSLGLAVLLGLTYDKEQGYWSGLALSISFTTKRQATFSGANARAQGTALGSIYGVLGYFICHRFAILRLLFLLPWIVFTTFLRHSKSYGEAGGISAIIAAFLILGREGYGTPSEFGIARMTEACIGLCCYIFVEVALQPNRAATLSKAQLSQCFGAIKDFTDQFLVIGTSQSSQLRPLIEDEKRKIQNKVVTLKEFIREAKTEPNFWFTPFQNDSYALLESSISKMVYLLSFTTSATELFSHELTKLDCSCKDKRRQISTDVELFKTKLCSSLKYLEEGTSGKLSPSTQPFSVQVRKELEAENSGEDLEVGISGNKFRTSSINEEEHENITNSFLQHSWDVTENSQVANDAEQRNKLLLCLGCIGFCMRSLVIEAREAEKVVKELSRKEK
ncbi:hypothetical protein AKJ16_DCAP05684 [Drosera capensis]